MYSSRSDPSKRTVDFWIRDIPDLQFDGKELYCKPCNKAISWKVKSSVIRHISSENHKRSISGTNNTDKQRNFNLDLVEVMVGCNIPWAKLDNPLFRQFLQKCVSGQYGTVSVPSESTLRKNYLSLACNTVPQKVSSQVDGKYIWLMVHETISSSGWNLINVKVGELNEFCSVDGHLIMSKVQKNITSRTVVDVVHSCLRALWGNKYSESLDKLLLFVTDATPYMKASGVMLKKTYKSMLHVSCLAQELHRVAEAVKECYPDVNTLISSVEKVFYKAPDRLALFQEILPNTALPPEVIPARWGTWIQATSYYYSNFDGVKSVIQRLNTDDAAAVSDAYQAFMDPTVQKNLEYIHGHFSRIAVAMRQLEDESKTDFTAVDAMNVVFDLRHYIFRLMGHIPELVKEQFENNLNDNSGFISMSHIVDLLNGKQVDFSKEDTNIATFKYFTYFKYAPLICD